MDTNTSAIDASAAIVRLTAPGNIGNLVNREIIHSTDLHTDGDTTTQLQLAVSHDKDRKQFTARLSVVGIEDRGGYTVTVSTPFVRERSRRLPGKDVARYSANALMQFRSETMAMLAREPDWLDLDLSPWGTPPADPAAGALSLAKLY